MIWTQHFPFDSRAFKHDFHIKSTLLIRVHDFRESVQNDRDTLNYEAEEITALCHSVYIKFTTYIAAGIAIEGKTYVYPFGDERYKIWQARENTVQTDEVKVH